MGRGLIQTSGEKWNGDSSCFFNIQLNLNLCEGQPSKQPFSALSMKIFPNLVCKLQKYKNSNMQYWFRFYVTWQCVPPIDREA